MIPLVALAIGAPIMGAAPPALAVTCASWQTLDTLTNGNDNVAYFGGDWCVYALDGNDTVSLSDATTSNRLFAGKGADVIDGGSGFDQIQGNLGGDTLRGHGGHDELVGGGNDDTLRGQDGDDLIIDGPGLDVMTGGAGNDTLYECRDPNGDWQHQDITDFEHVDLSAANCDLAPFGTG